MQFNKKAKVEVTGVNFGELVALIQKAQIAVNFRRISDTVMLFETNNRNLPILFDILTKKCYTYKVYRTSGLNLWQVVGGLVGLMLMSILLIVLSLFCFGTKVIAADPNVETAISEYLNSQNCTHSMWRNIDCDTLETQIMSAIPEVSMVNVSRKGVYLIVNTSIGTLPNEPNNVEDNSTGIFATREGIVSRIFVASGTPLVKVGDTVSVGQMLVAPYILDAEENQTPVKIRADVYLYTWESSCVEFCENGVEYVRTGNYVSATKTMFGGTVLTNQEVVVSYATYEVQTSRRYLSSVLPLAVETTYYFETVATPTTRNFDAEKDALIYEAKQKLFSKIDENDTLEQKYTINKVDDKYYVNYYAKCEYKVG